MAHEHYVSDDGTIMAKTNKVVSIGSRKEGTINRYRGKAYIHFLDKHKGKTLTFSSDEFEILLRKRDKIKKIFKDLKNKKGKKSEKSFSETESENLSSDNEDEDGDSN